MTTIEEQALTASGTMQEPKGATKPNAAPRKPRVAPSKPRSRKKTTPAKKAAKAGNPCGLARTNPYVEPFVLKLPKPRSKQ